MKSTSLTADDRRRAAEERNTAARRDLANRMLGCLPHESAPFHEKPVGGVGYRPHFENLKTGLTTTRAPAVGA